MIIKLPDYNFGATNNVKGNTNMPPAKTDNSNFALLVGGLLLGYLLFSDDKKKEEVVSSNETNDKKPLLLDKLRASNPLPYNPPKGKFDETYSKGIEALEVEEIEPEINEVDDQHLLKENLAEDNAPEEESIIFKKFTLIRMPEINTRTWKVDKKDGTFEQCSSLKEAKELVRNLKNKPIEAKVEDE